MSDNFGGCRVDVGSLTVALKAQKALGKAAIPSTVVKNTSSSFSGKGCSYGLSFSCVQKANAEKVLKSAGVRVREWIPES